MDLLTVGNTVTIRVKNILWPNRHLYANGYVGPEFNVYTGTVMREKWFDSDEIGLTTNNPDFTFRRIKRHRIVEVNNKQVDYVKPVEEKRIEITVQGSKGNSYTVVKENGKKSCTCPGFGFRRTCKHIESVV
jgi:uncharacterized Zn finger protein